MMIWQNHRENDTLHAHWLQKLVAGWIPFDFLATLA
jgi:hypothetical protein